MAQLCCLGFTLAILHNLLKHDLLHHPSAGVLYIRQQPPQYSHIDDLADQWMMLSTCITLGVINIFMVSYEYC